MNMSISLAIPFGTEMPSEPQSDADQTAQIGEDFAILLSAPVSSQTVPSPTPKPTSDGLSDAVANGSEPIDCQRPVEQKLSPVLPIRPESFIPNKIDRQPLPTRIPQFGEPVEMTGKQPRLAADPIPQTESQVQPDQAIVGSILPEPTVRKSYITNSEIPSDQRSFPNESTPLSDSSPNLAQNSVLPVRPEYFAELKTGVVNTVPIRPEILTETKSFAIVPHHNSSTISNELSRKSGEPSLAVIVDAFAQSEKRVSLPVVVTPGVQPTLETEVREHEWLNLVDIHPATATATEPQVRTNLNADIPAADGRVDQFSPAQISEKVIVAGVQNIEVPKDKRGLEKTFSDTAFDVVPAADVNLPERLTSVPQSKHGVVATSNHALLHQIEPTVLSLAAAVRSEHTRQSLKLKLHPAELGTVEITLIKNDSGSVSAQITADNASAQSSLNESIVQLRDSLENAGFQVEKLEVGLRSSSSNDQGGDHQRPSHHGTASSQPEPVIDRSGISERNDGSESRLVSLRA